MPVTGICLAVATAATYNGILLLMAQQGHHRKTIIFLASQVKHESEQKKVKQPMKTKTEIVVKALLLGLEVELENRTYRLFRNGEKFNMPNHNTGYADTPWLGIRMCQDKPVFCGAELPLCAVIQIAEKLPDDEIGSLAKRVALKDEPPRMRLEAAA